MHATPLRCLTHQPILRARKAAAKVSELHNDIPSFLKYAKGALLAADTTVYVGTLYEYTVLETLKSCGMTLERVGGCGDRGKDLLGNWTIPNLPSEDSQAPRCYSAVVSCKLAKTSPASIRELEGAMTSSGPNTIGILANPHNCSPGTKKHLLSAQRPLAFCTIKSYEEGGYLEQFVWNRFASELLPRVGVKTRYGVDGTPSSRVILTVGGHEIDSPVLSKCKLRHKP